MSRVPKVQLEKGVNSQKNGLDRAANTVKPKASGISNLSMDIIPPLAEQNKQ